MANTINFGISQTGMVQEIKRFASILAFPYVGEETKLYIDLANNVIYRWDTVSKTYILLSNNMSNYEAIDGNVY